MALNNAVQSEDLIGLDLGGVIHESVLDQLFDLSENIDTPLSDRIGRGTHSNEIHEWTQDQLQSAGTAPVADGAEGSTPTTSQQRRVRNHSQINLKSVKVTERVQGLSPIGFANTLAEMITNRGIEVKRDIEYWLTANNASVASVTSTAGESAGLEAWIEPLDIDGSTVLENVIDASGGTIAGGGWSNHTAGVIPAYTYTTVTPGELNIADIETVAQGIWTAGGNPSVAISRPKVIAAWSKFMFDSGAKIATLQQDQGVKDQTAVASVNVFLTNFGVTLEMVASRVMPFGDTASSTPDASTLFIIDPSMLEISFLLPMHVTEIGKLGLTEKREISADWTLVVKNPSAHGMIQGIDQALAAAA